jgi:protein tyrosine phosphatase type 4A
MPNIKLIEVPVQNRCLRFLVCDCPTNFSIGSYVEEFKKYHVKKIIRLCEKTYDSNHFRDIAEVIDFTIIDGGVPDEQTIKEWIIVLNDIFFRNDLYVGTNSQIPSNLPSVAIHCTAGLGRAPLMVAIALVVFTSKNYLDVVYMLRAKLGTVLNTKQLNYLSNFDNKKYLKMLHWRNTPNCVVM